MSEDKFNKLGYQYNTVEEYRDDVLVGKISLYKPANELLKQDLINFLNRLNQFLPQSVLKFYCEQVNDIESDNDSARDSGVETEEGG